MRRRSGFIMQHIFDTDYILPYGQNIADHKRGIELNSTAAFVWDLLENEMPREEVRSKYIERFSTKTQDKEALEKDIDLFLDTLIAQGFIEGDAPTLPASGPCYYLKIASLVLLIHGPKKLIESSYLNDFSIEPTEHADMIIEVRAGVPDFNDNGRILLRDPELWVLDRDKDHLLLFPTLPGINEVSVSKDGERVCFYCDPPVTEELITEFFHALRHVFLYAAQKKGMYAIHSASILYREKAWLFSAVSGTGKSTHTDLWAKLYGTETINGDLNLIAFDGDKPVIHGTPWCGTSGIYNKKTIPLGGIVLLRRSASDAVSELSPERKALLIMQRFISPMWNAAQLESVASFSEYLSKKITVCLLNCTKNDSAAMVMRAWIDDHIARE